jgi:predicted Zn finger-like uncharacterized protein
MVTRKLACPSCGVGLRVADSGLDGKKIRCPKCGDAFPVSAGNGARPRPKPAPVEEDECPFEVVDEQEPEPAPVRRRPKRKARSNNNGLLVGGLIAGAVVLIGAGVTLGVMYWPGGNKTNTNTVANNSRTGSVAGATGSSGPLSAGQQVFQSNCARCHSTGGDGGGRGKGRSRGPNLANVGRNPEHTVDWLMAFIREPTSKHPDSSMPGFEGRINDDDLRVLAEYLASLK